MTDNEKKLIQAQHRLEKAQARDRKTLPQTREMELNELENYLSRLTN